MDEVSLIADTDAHKYNEIMRDGNRKVVVFLGRGPEGENVIFWPDVINMVKFRLCDDEYLKRFRKLCTKRSISNG